MTISVPLAEPKTVDYIFIDENNRVHILLPVVGGDTIGLDNTCKTVIELQTFFYGQKELKDKEGAITQHRRPSALEVFAEYIKKIEQDINLLSKLGIYEKLLEEKKQRLEQMKQYVSLLSKVQDLYVNPTTEYPISPDEIHYLFKQQTNALTIHLSPETPDRFLNTSGPIFSLKRQEAHFYLQYNQQQFGVRPEDDVYDGFGPKLRAALRVKLQEPSSVSSPKDTIIAEVTAHYEGQPKPSLKDLQDFTTTLIRQKNPEGLKNLDLTHYSDNQLIDESFFNAILNFLWFDQQVKLKRWIAHFFINAYTNCMCQHFSCNTVGKIPQFTRPNFLNIKTIC
jgi:effector protein SidC